jgi:serine/threonine protein kinase
MSPEQCLGDEVDGRTDVYAFGVVCFEALTGKPPFDADSYLALMTQHTTAERPPVSSRRPDLGRGLDDVLCKMMALDPDERFATLMAALEALATAMGETLSSTTPAVPLPRPRGAGPRATSSNTAMDASSAIGVPTSSSRAPLLIGLVVVVGVGLYWATANLGAKQQTQTASTAVASAKPIQSTPSVPTASTVTTVLAPKPTAAPITQFEVTLSTETREAKAYLGDKELGLLPGPFELEGEQGSEVTLTVKAPAHLPATVTVTLEPDQEAQVVLQPVPTKRLNDDLEEF